MLNEVILGDCLEVMKDIPAGSVDMILCDLPYGTTKCSWDVVIPFDELWYHYERICKDDAAIVLFGQEPFSSYLRLSNIDWYKYDLYWEKERLTNIHQVKRRFGKTIETISIFYKKQPCYNPQMVPYYGKKRTNKVKSGKLGKLTDDTGEKKVKEYSDTGYRYPTQVLSYKRDILTSNLHPTQKPLALCEMLVKTFTDEGQTVLDNTCGSGTTGLACISTGRDYIMIEKNPEYHHIASERLKSAFN